jgi:dolichol-phosphate mannosyltransferase
VIIIGEQGDDGNCGTKHNIYDLTVLIPTFNECENVSGMIKSVDTVCNNAGIKCFILVVDDDSHDGTGEIVHKLMETRDNLGLIVRYHNHGLSQSLYDGLQAAPTKFVQCIDCDFSHPPELIPLFYKSLSEENCDIVIGSRYLPGGGSINWPLSRRILSYGASIIGRLVIPLVHDSGSGFFAINTRVLSGAQLTPRGFRMCFEILGKGVWKKVKEIPFIFRNREIGKSKLKPLIVIQYLIQTMDIIQYNLILKKSKNIQMAWRMHLTKNYEM